MDVSFLTKPPSEGAKLLFQHSHNLSNNDLWNLFDFLLWEYHETDVDKLFTWYRELMSAGEGFNTAFIKGHKFVCAATIKEGDPIYRCKTCQMDGTNLLCVECFKHSDHTGHDWTPTFTPGSGCCDCGDPESWDTKGFCTHHPGPDAGESIQIPPNQERVARLLCGYVVYILSHALSPNHYDVLYIEEKLASKSNYIQSSSAAKKDTQPTSSKSTKKTSASGGGMFSGLFNFGDEEEEEEEDEDVAMNEDASDAAIVTRYHTFIALLNESNAKERILAIQSVEYRPDGDDYVDAGESENCALGWKHPHEVCIDSLQCNSAYAMEVVWKLRMYNKSLIAIGPLSLLSPIAKQWQSFDYISPENPPYSTQLIEAPTLTRVVTAPVMLKMMTELKDWSNDSEILKRVIASCLMLNIDTLGPQCVGLRVIGKLSVIIPPFRQPPVPDANDVEMKGNNDNNNEENAVVTEEETAIYHLILNDHVLEQKYNAPLIDLWFALVVIPAFKERVTQVFTSCYGKMMKFWDFINRQTQHCFVPLSVQFFTKKTTANVCESHRLIETLFDTHLSLSCPRFVKAQRDYCDEHKVDCVDAMQIFNARHMKANWTRQWMLSKKSTHCLYDIRYLLSISDFMEYICFESRFDAMDHFWKRLLNLLATYQHSKYQHRQCGREHILMEDQTMVNVLRLDSTINGINHRYLLNGLNALCTKLKPPNDAQKLRQALDMILNALGYGLSLMALKPYDNFDFYFKEEMDAMDLDDNTDDDDPNQRRVTMKLNNFDGGYLECPYFRADRDQFSLTLHLSKTLCNIAKLYCDVSGDSFAALIQTLKDKFGSALDATNLFDWMDFSLVFVSAFNQFHSDLLRKNGGVFATMIYNMEKPNFFSLFFSHNFYHIANHATQVFGASDFMILLYDWFCSEPIELFCAHRGVEQKKLNALCDAQQTGWKHWADRARVMKMVKNTLNELLAIVSEPQYTLCLDNEDAHTEAMIRYELIQWLIFSKFTMSELESRVIMFGKIERPDIRPILNDIAVYEAPQAMNAGKFRLKAEYYREFNPYYRKYGKFNEFFGTADEQSEAIDHYIAAMKKQAKNNTTNKQVMFPNWPYTTQLAAASQLNVLSAPFMGLIWNCVLYHFYIDDKMRVNATNVQQILRLISIAVQAITEKRFDLQSEIGRKLINNFVESFKFRLTDEWDYIQDDNKDTIIKKYGGDLYTNHSINTADDNNNNNTDDDTKADDYHKKALQRYNQVMMSDESGAGVGSSLWLLCKMMVDSKPAQDSNKAKLTHIGASQLLLIEKILITLHAMKVDALQNVMTPLWSPPSLATADETKTAKKKKKKQKLSAAEKRKRKAARAREKAMKKMQQKKANFASQNKDKIRKDAQREELEEKQQKEAFGIGVKYQCIVCRSRDKQDSMSMMAFATKCCIMERCMNNNRKPFSTTHNRSFDDIAFYNKGLNFSFCGHCVHKSCYDTYIKQIQSAHNSKQHYAGRGSINILKREFCCPYCKTVSNILVPLHVVYRNPGMKVEKYNKIQTQIQKMENIEQREARYSLEKQSAIGTKLCDDFFKSIGCIWDRYAHSLKQHTEYVSKIGTVFSTLSIANTLSYSIACEEMNFRDLPPHSRKDRLSRIASNINAFIAALWSLSQYTGNDDANASGFDREVVKQYSWDVIERKLWIHRNINDADNKELKENADDDKYCYDPFVLLCRGIVCYPNTFSMMDTLMTPAQPDPGSNVRMDISDDEDPEEDMKEEEDVCTAPDLYRLLLSCYMMQISQLAVSYCDDANITACINNEERKQELSQFIGERIIPFLRRSCILYNAFGCMDGLDDLWNADTMMMECDALCGILCVPMVTDVLRSIGKEENEYFTNYISNLNASEREYLKVSRNNCNWDKGDAFSLIELPSSYNELFQIAAFAQCKKTGIRPKYSAICLVCGEYVCLACCKTGLEPLSQRGEATRHCLECNNGFGVFLWLQKSKVIIIWNNLGVLFKSVYLDKYGEEDCGLIRGNRVALNTERYHQLCQIITQHKIPNKLVQLRKTNRDLLERQLAF